MKTVAIAHKVTKLPSQIQFISKSDEKLLAEYRSGNKESGNQLIQKYAKIPQRCAQYYIQRFPEFEKSDLLQTGILGLIKALKGYNKSNERYFDAYCSFCVKNEIYKYVSGGNGNIKIPAHLYHQKDEISLAAQNSHPYNSKYQQYNEAKSATGNYPYKPLTEEVSLKSISNSVKSDTNVEEEAINTILAKKAIKIINTLPQRHAEYIKMYFGLDGNPVLTFQEISNKYGISRQAIMQNMYKTLAKIRKKIEE